MSGSNFQSLLIPDCPKPEVNYPRLRTVSDVTDCPKHRVKSGFLRTVVLFRIIDDCPKQKVTYPYP